MNKLFVILILLLLAKIQTFACDTSSLQKTLISEIKKELNIDCKVTSVNKSKKSLIADCESGKSYVMSAENGKIYFLTQTISKYPFITQCWIEGSYSESSCQAQLQPQQCQSWNMTE